MARAEIRVRLELVGIGGPKRLFILRRIERLFRMTLVPQVVEIVKDEPKVPKPARPIYRTKLK